MKLLMQGKMVSGIIKPGHRLRDGRWLADLEQETHVASRACNRDTSKPWIVLFRLMA